MFQPDPFRQPDHMPLPGPLPRPLPGPHAGPPSVSPSVPLPGPHPGLHPGPRPVALPPARRGLPHLSRPAAARGTPAPGRYLRFGKRALDFGCVLVALPVALPLVMVLALLVMADGGSPFFGHLRAGRGGGRFRCWKLRTMVPDAEARLAGHLAADPAARAEWAAGCKLARDPRVTPLGRILRRTSLDELPQLWNILRGEMSLVGPRPVTAAELVRYGAALRDYTALRPGLTGLWQVSGRSATSYAERVALDSAYARRMGPGLDLWIIGATLREVLRRSGL